MLERSLRNKVCAKSRKFDVNDEIHRNFDFEKWKSKLNFSVVWGTFMLCENKINWAVFLWSDAPFLQLGNIDKDSLKSDLRIEDGA